MKHSRTWRGLAIAVAAVMAFGIAPLAASADSERPEPGTAALEAPASAAHDQFASTDAGQDFSALATATTPDAVWDFFRVMNSRRIDQGGSPWVLNPTLTTVSNTWLAQKTTLLPTNDPNVVGKIPGSFTMAWHNTGWAIATSAAEAVRELTPSLMASDLLWAPTTDIGIGMTEEPYAGAYKLYSFSVVAVDYAHTSAQAGEMTLFRFYQPATGTHFYSTSVAERNSVATSAAYRYEGQIAYVLTPNVTTSGTANLNRFYQPGSGTHFYTSSPAEYNQVRTYPQYSLDGVAGKVYARQVSGVTPMYRFFRPASGTHFYTANASEVETVKNIPGYTYEGVAFFLRRAS